MILTVSSKNLKTAIKHVSPILGMSLDPNSNFKNHVCFISDDSGTKLLATNGLTRYEYDLTASVIVADPGRVAVVYDKLVTCLEQINSDAEIVLELKEKTLFLRSGKKETQLKTINASDFRPIEKFEGSEIKIPFESTQILNKASLTLGRDPTVKKAHGLLCDLKEIDGHKSMVLKTATLISASRIYEKFECEENVNTSFVIPEFLVDEAAGKPLQSLCLTGTSIIAKFPNFMIQSPLPENVFVDVDKVMKDMTGRDISFARDDLRDTVKFVKSTMDKHSVKMKFVVNDNQVEVSSYSETAKSKDTVKCASSENFSFTVDGDVLLKFLNSVPENEIMLKVSEKALSYNKDNYQFVEVCFNMG